MTPGHHPLIRKLEHYTRFSEDERRALTEAAADQRRFGVREDVIREGDAPEAVNLVISGFACRYKSLPDGRRQILAFFVPGDFCDYRNFLLSRMDHSIGTLTQAKVAMIPRRTMDALLDRHEGVGRAMGWAQLVEESIGREWLTSLGQRTAFERTAHLFCELFWRLRTVGQTRGDACEMPFTQVELGDTLGLSAVHVNRTLQELRRQELIVLRGGELTVPDLEALQNAAMFDPGYLHLQGGEAGPEEGVRTRA